MIATKPMKHEWESSCGWLLVWGAWAEHRNQLQRELKKQPAERKDFDLYELEIHGLA